MTIEEFQKEILSWYVSNRRDLPWRNTKDPYKILVSEIMLQQTQVSRVIPKYEEFLRLFPSIEKLAKAPRSKVLKVWSGLGYWRRALYLHQTAKRLVFNQVKQFPRDPKELEKLPGIGHYTARAITCFAFGNTDAFLDTNIRRIYLHFFFPRTKDVPDEKILRIAQKAVWKKDAREWHYALFDYGAIVLKNKSVNERSKHYRKQSIFKGSFRSFRTATIRFLLSRSRPTIAKKNLQAFVSRKIQKSKSPYNAHDVISALIKDGVLKESKTAYFL